jgi:hypothetical protein
MEDVEAVEAGVRGRKRGPGRGRWAENRVLAGGIGRAASRKIGWKAAGKQAFFVLELDFPGGSVHISCSDQRR